MGRGNGVTCTPVAMSMFEADLEEERRTRTHVVLGTPTRGPFAEGLETVAFAIGCFWGGEKGFWRLPGVHSTSVGYVAGALEYANPTYGQVCTGETLHAEAVQVVYDPAAVSFVDLLAWFWACHDPTQGNAQGNDTGSQYRSGIYCRTEAQQTLALASRRAYQQALDGAKAGRGDAGGLQGYSQAARKLAMQAARRATNGTAPITTEVCLADPARPEHLAFYYAEDSHQQYLARPGSRPYCSAMPTGVHLPAFESWRHTVGNDAAAGFDAHAHAPFLPAAFWAKHGPKKACVIRQPNAQLSWATEERRPSSTRRAGAKVGAAPAARGTKRSGGAAAAAVAEPAKRRWWNCAR